MTTITTPSSLALAPSLAEHLTRKAGAKPFSTHVLATFPDLDLRDLRQLQNQYWNAFKACKDA
jgi:hypothetical protein